MITLNDLSVGNVIKYRVVRSDFTEEWRQIIISELYTKEVCFTTVDGSEHKADPKQLVSDLNFCEAEIIV